MEHNKAQHLPCLLSVYQDEQRRNKERIVSLEEALRSIKVMTGDVRIKDIIEKALLNSK